MYNRIIFLLCFVLACAVCAFGQSRTEKIVDKENRMAIIIDTTVPENPVKYQNALDSLIKTLINSGIDGSRIIVLSNICKEPEFKPTSTNIRALLGVIRNRNLRWIKNNNNRDVLIRPNLDKPSELQIYLNAGGVSNESQTRFLIIPSDIDEEAVKSTFDEGLISITEDIEEAMLSEQHAKKLERTLLVININSVISVTRSASRYNGSSLKDSDLSKLNHLLKSAYLEDEDEEEEDGPKTFRYTRILTKNQSLNASSVENFYDLLKRGLEGYADIAGNHDGVVQDIELAEYIQSTNKGFSNLQVEHSFNGNAVYPIANCKIEVEIPTGLFKKIGDAFTRDEYKVLRDSAYAREKTFSKKQNGDKK